MKKEHPQVSHPKSTVDSSEIQRSDHHLECQKLVAYIMGETWINYQPQLVITGFLNHQQYVPSLI